MSYIVFVNHTAERSPGDCVAVEATERQRLIESGMARVATAQEVDAAQEAAARAEEAEAAAVEPEKADADPSAKKK